MTTDKIRVEHRVKYGTDEEWSIWDNYTVGPEYMLYTALTSVSSITKVTLHQDGPFGKAKHEYRLKK